MTCQRLEEENFDHKLPGPTGRGETLGQQPITRQKIKWLKIILNSLLGNRIYSSENFLAERGGGGGGGGGEEDYNNHGRIK